MIEKIVSRRNLNEAIRQVVANQGSAGIDGMSVKTLTSYMKSHRQQIVTEILCNRYLPQAIRGVEIKKGRRSASPDLFSGSDRYPVGGGPERSPSPIPPCPPG